MAAEVRDSFVFKPFQDIRNIEIALEMSNCNSVAIHVRKGADYNSSINSGVCDLAYYKKGIELISEKIVNPVFYIFSDNPMWVKENFSFIEYKYIDWNPTTGFGNHLDMQLMSNAKHNIIANSTYSWWGAWLNPNKDKIVMAPFIWFNKDSIPKSSIELSMIPKNGFAI